MATLRQNDEAGGECRDFTRWNRQKGVVATVIFSKDFISGQKWRHPWQAFESAGPGHSGRGLQTSQCFDIPALDTIRQALSRVTGTVHRWTHWPRLISSRFLALAYLAIMPAGHLLSSYRTASPGANDDTVGFCFTTFIAASTGAKPAENRTADVQRIIIVRFTVPSVHS